MALLGMLFVILAVTQGAGAEDYTADGRFHVTTQELLKPLETIKYHTGLVFEEPFVLSGVLNLSEEALSDAANSYVERLSQACNSSILELQDTFR